MQTEGLVASGGIFFSSLVAFGLYGLDFYLALLFVFVSWVLGECSRLFLLGVSCFYSLEGGLVHSLLFM